MFMVILTASGLEEEQCEQSSEYLLLYSTDDMKTGLEQHTWMMTELKYS